MLAERLVDRGDCAGRRRSRNIRLPARWVVDDEALGIFERTSGHWWPGAGPSTSSAAPEPRGLLDCRGRASPVRRCRFQRKASLTVTGNPFPFACSTQVVLPGSDPAAGAFGELWSSDLHELKTWLCSYVYSIAQRRMCAQRKGHRGDAASVLLYAIGGWWAFE